MSEKIMHLGEDVPAGIGAVIKGWDVSEDHYRDPSTLSVVDFRAFSNACPWNCHHCFTEKSLRTLSLDEIRDVIDQLAEMGAKAINFTGEGEPTIDKNFFEILEMVQDRGMQAIVFTDGATRLGDREFVRRLYQTGASLVLKGDSLFNPDYQNSVVGDKSQRYFDRRQVAVDLLIEEGFNEVQDDGSTRMGFDMVLNKHNAHEVADTLRFCRDRNLWMMFAFYLPSGRSAAEGFKGDALSDDEKLQIIRLVQEIDKDEYGHDHPMFNNFLTMGCVELLQVCGDGRVTPCSGNEEIIGNIKDSTISELYDKVFRELPVHNPKCFDGNCIYRSNPLPLGD